MKKTRTVESTYKFTVHIRESKSKKLSRGGDKVFKQWYMVLVGRNGEVVATGEIRKSKSGLVKTINNLFPGVKIKMP